MPDPWEDYGGKTEPPSPSWPEYMKNYLAKGMGTIQEAAKSYFPAFAKGLALQSTEPGPTEGSVMEPNKLPGIARQAGEFTGKMLPMAAASYLTGPIAGTVGRAGLPLAVEMAETGPVMSKIAQIGLPAVAEGAQGAAAMGLYKGAENLANKGIPKTGSQVGELASETSKGALGGFGLGSILGLAGQAATALGTKLPTWFYNNVIRLSKSEAGMDIKHGDFELLGNEMANLPGFYGSKQQLIDNATQNVNRIESQLDNVLAPYIQEEAKAGYSSINTEKVLDPAKKLSERWGRMKGVGIEKQKGELDDYIDNFRKEYGENMQVGTAHPLKKDIWAEIKDPQWRKTADQNPLFARWQKLLGSGLRREIINTVPEAAPLLAEEGIYLGARQAAEDRLATEGGRSLTGSMMDAAQTGTGRFLRYSLNKGEGLPRKITSAVIRPALGVETAEKLR